MLQKEILVPTFFFLLSNQVVVIGKVVASDGSYV